MRPAVLSAALAFADRVFSDAWLGAFGEGPALVTLLFHRLFADSREIESKTAAPGFRITGADFARIVEHFLERGYLFTDPAGILAGLDPGRKHVMLTFDDGYFNNTRALPVLKGFGVPAAFYVCTDFVRLGKGFWWDVLYRERSRRGIPESAIWKETASLKRKPVGEIEAHLRAEFGDAALRPAADADRPFTPAELKEFSKEPLVTIGNHTTDHTILTTLDPEDIRSRIMGAQKFLGELLGAPPETIAYPNGDCNESVVRVVQECGFKLGITVDPRKDPLPVDLSGNGRFRLGRFFILGGTGLDRWCRKARYDITLRGLARRVFGR